MPARTPREMVPEKDSRPLFLISRQEMVQSKKTPDPFLFARVWERVVYGDAVRDSGMATIKMNPGKRLGS